MQKIQNAKISTFWKATPMSPLNLVSSGPCQLWFDGMNPNSFILDNSYVNQWSDLSGFGRHVMNTNDDTTRPTYSSITGRTTFVAAASTYLQNAAFDAALIQPNTIFILCKITGGLADTEVIFDGVTAREYFYFSASKFIMSAGVDLTDGATDVNDNIHTGEFNGAASNYWINSILVVGSANCGTGNLNGITLAARNDFLYPADIEIMEVFGYNCLITTNERNKCTNYLKKKWELSY